jgi:hypothetical protein
MAIVPFLKRIALLHSLLFLFDRQISPQTVNNQLGEELMNRLRTLLDMSGAEK